MREPKYSRRARQAILAVLMLTVLLAALGGAWVMQRRADLRVRAGADIFAGLRTGGLEARWPEARTIHWYLIDSRSAPVGWRAEFRLPDGSGGFAGGLIQVIPRQRYFTETWRINRRLDDCRHTDTSYDRGVFCTTALRDGAVTTVWGSGGLRLTAQSPAPENYLPAPEGLLRLLLACVADARADAQFRTTFNDRGGSGAVVDFGTIRLKYLGAASRQDGARVARVAVSSSRSQALFDTYELDDRGGLHASGQDGLSLAPATEEAVARAFPDARARVEQLLRTPVEE